LEAASQDSLNIEIWISNMNESDIYPILDALKASKDCLKIIKNPGFITVRFNMGIGSVQIELEDVTHTVRVSIRGGPLDSEIDFDGILIKHIAFLESNYDWDFYKTDKSFHDEIKRNAMICQNWLIPYLTDPSAFKRLEIFSMGFDVGCTVSVME
jgi:hypothetical protein